MNAIYSQLQGLDDITLNLGGGTGPILSVVLALIMFGVALDIRLSTLKNVFTHPRSVLTGICLQWIGLPLVTFVLIMLLSRWITPMVALGMLLVASCPGGNISNFMSSFAKGNVELSVSMTALATVCAPVITPLNFLLWGNLYLDFARLSNTLTIPQLVIPFWDIFTTVFIILGIPIVLGMLCAHYLPNFTKKIQKPFSIFSIVVFLVMVLGMFIPNWQLFVKYIIFVFIIVLIHNACAFGTGWCGASLMRLPRRDRRSITIEVGIQNSGLGLTLLLNPAIFDPALWNSGGVHYGGILFVTAWWGIWHIISGLTIATIFRKSTKRVNQ